MKIINKNKQKKLTTLLRHTTVFAFVLLLFLGAFIWPAKIAQAQIVESPKSGNTFKAGELMNISVSFPPPVFSSGTLFSYDACLPIYLYLFKENSGRGSSSTYFITSAQELKNNILQYTFSIPNYVATGSDYKIMFNPTANNIFGTTCPMSTLYSDAFSINGSSGDGGSGGGGGGGGGGDGSGSGKTNSLPPYVSTGMVTEVTDTTAVLSGEGGPNPSNPSKLQTTGYFRYSPMTIPPIFCNDIYGPGMFSTEDANLGKSGNAVTFKKRVTNLVADTDYYYCAVASDQQNISYGQVKSFHTALPADSQKITANTGDPLVLGSDSALLKGYFSAPNDAVVYFQYRKTISGAPRTGGGQYPGGDTFPGFPEANIWKNIGTQNFSADTYYAAKYKKASGYPSFTLTGLAGGTKYDFRIAVCVSPMTLDKNGQCSNSAGASGGGVAYGEPVTFETKISENTSLPDLSASNIVPISATAGMPTTFSAAIINKGTGVAGFGGQIGNIFQYYEDSNPDKIIVSPTIFTDKIEAGGNATIHFLQKLSGNTHMRACADRGQDNSSKITESNEDNNCGPWTPIAVYPAPAAKLSAEPNKIDQGSSSNLDWSSENTVSCSGYGFDTGGKVKGTISVSPSKAAKYSVTCTGPGGSASDIASVGVGPGTTVSITADYMWIPIGKSVKLTWSSVNAVSCSASAEPAATDWTGEKAIGKSSADVTPSSTTTYTISCKKAAGAPDTAKDSVTVTVQSGGGGGGGFGGGGDWNNWTWNGKDWSSQNWKDWRWSGNNWTYGGSGTGNFTYGGGSGTYTYGTGTKIGEKATPPWDAIVRYHEGIETVFARQIVNRPDLATLLGYQSGMDLQQFANTVADNLARYSFAYINPNKLEVRVSYPDVAAYELRPSASGLTVYEYFKGVIVDIRNTTTTFKNKSYYEYYFQK